MDSFRVPSSAIRQTAAILLLAMLLFAQAVGQAHRIVHAGWGQGKTQALSLSAESGSLTDKLTGDERDTSASAHSCVALDAATLADANRFLPPAFPVLTGTQVLALWAAYASWEAPLHLPFCSRAPPRT